LESKKKDLINFSSFCFFFFFKKFVDETAQLLTSTRTPQAPAKQSMLSNLVDIVTDEHFNRDDGTSFCYCSIFGLGPAWTL